MVQTKMTLNYGRFVVVAVVVAVIVAAEVVTSVIVVVTNYRTKTATNVVYHWCTHTLDMYMF